MPDHSKYPAGFSPNQVYIPEPTRPQEEFEHTEELHEETYYSSYNFNVMELDDLRKQYPTATHIHLSVDCDDDRSPHCKVTIQRRTTSPNLRYSEQMKAYERAKADREQKMAAWQALSKQWKDEEAAEKREADYRTYLRLKAQFDPPNVSDHNITG